VPPTVERLGPGDWQRLRAVRLAALAESPEMFGSSLSREQGFDEAEWRARAARPATFIASVQGADVGLAGVYEFDDGWCVMGMWVAPAARGTGVVDALVDRCESTVADAGATGVSLWVMRDNERGIGAYRRLGFRATDARQPSPHGCEVLMVKTLGGAPAGPR